MELIEKLYFDIEEKTMKLSIIIPVYNAENDIGIMKLTMSASLLMMEVQIILG